MSATGIENAIWAWIVAGSGLDEQNVIWAGRGPSPSGMHIAMRLAVTDAPGHDWVDRAATDEGDITYTVRGPRIATLTLQCIAPIDGPESGETTCAGILDRALQVRMLPSVAADLDAGGVGVGRIGPIRAVPGIRSQLFEPRAVVEITLHMTAEVSEIGAAIEHVEVEGDVDDGALTISGWVPDAPPGPES